MRGALALVGLAGALSLPAAASAATFYVDDDATQPLNPCTDPAPTRACTLINDAVGQARDAAGGPHTIMVAPGLYVEEVTLSDVDDSGLTIRGAGAGGDALDPATQSILQYANDDGLNDGALEAHRPGILIREMRVRVPAGAQYLNDPAVIIEGLGSAIEDSRVEVLEPTAGLGLNLEGPSTRVERVITTSVASAPLRLGLNATNALVRDTQATATSTAGAVVCCTSGARFQRTVLRSGETTGLFIGGGTVSVADSLILGGQQGVDSYQASVSLRHVTIDAGTPKVRDESGIGITSRADAPNTNTVNVFDSIVLERQALSQTGDKSINCEDSDVPNQIESPQQGTGMINCPAGPGNPAGNQTSVPAELFVPAASDWHLRPGSPVVDISPLNVIGNQDPAQALDLDLNPRLVDGDGDGTALTDLGPYELQPACRGVTGTILAKPGQTAVGTSGRDVIVGSIGRDLIRGGGGGDRICGATSGDRLLGGKGKDRLFGQAGRDRLRGGRGRDRLFGGPGRDRLLGGPGRDVLRGGPGRDRQRQ